MELSGLVPILAAMVGAIALLSAADLLTATGRLRRKLDKELIIADKLRPGPARKEMQSLAQRHALELFYRERHWDTVPTVIPLVTSCLLVFVITLLLFYLQQYPQWSAAPVVQGYVLPLVVVGLLIQLILIGINFKARQDYVEKMMTVDSAPRPMGRARLSRQPTSRPSRRRGFRRSTH